MDMNWKNSLLRELALRKNTIKPSCEKFRERLDVRRKWVYGNYMIDTEHQIAYCRHGKVYKTSLYDSIWFLSHINLCTYTMLYKTKITANGV